jgi:hypothetical protein
MKRNLKYGNIRRWPPSRSNKFQNIPSYNPNSSLENCKKSSTKKSKPRIIMKYIVTAFLGLVLAISQALAAPTPGCIKQRDGETMEAFEK